MRNVECLKNIYAKQKEYDNPKWAMRTWLLALGFIGEQYSYARKLFTKHLIGNGAFKNKKD